LVNAIWGVPTTPIVVIGIPKLLLNFLHAKTPLDPRPKFVVDPINTPPLTKIMAYATIVSTQVVDITTLTLFHQVVSGFQQLPLLTLSMKPK